MLRSLKILRSIYAVQYTDPTQFSSIWNSSKSLKEAARRAKTTKLRATARASRLRREGWAMKQFPRGRKAKA